MNNHITAKSDILVIISMHRSGSSLTASLLQSAGLHIGRNLMEGDEKNVKGYYENLDFYDFHRTVLASQGVDENGWTLQEQIDVEDRFIEEAKEIVAKASVSEIWGWKEPRTTLFLDFWANLLPQAKFLLIYRSPWEVVESLYRQNHGLFKTQPELAVKLWMHYNQKILNFYNHSSSRCLLVNTKTLIQNPAASIEAINQKFKLQLAPPDARIYDPSLFRSQGLDSYRPSLIESQFPEAVNLYQELDARAWFPENTPDLSWRELIKPSPYRVWAFRDWVNVCKLEKENKEQSSQLEQYQGADNQTGTKLDQLQSRLDATEALLEQSQSQLHQAETVLEQFQFKLHQTQEELEESHTELCQTQALLSHFQSQLHQTEIALEQSQSQLYQSQSQLSATEALLSQSQSQLSETEIVLEEFQSQWRHAQADLEDSQSQLSATDSALEHSLSQLSETEILLEQSLSQVEAIQQELQRSQSQMHASEEALENLQSQWYQAQGELQDSQSQIHQTQAQLQQSQSQFQETEGLLQQSQSQLQETEGLLQEFQCQLDKTETSMQQSCSQRNQIERELKRTQHQFVQAQLELQLYQGDLQQSQSQLHETENSMQESCFQRNQIERELQLYHDQIVQAQEELKLYQGQSDRDRSQLDLAVVELEQRELLLEQYQDHVHQLQAELQSKISQLDSKQAQLERLQFQQAIPSQLNGHSNSEYDLLVWDAWCAYCNGNLPKMCQCLQQSLKCSSFLPTMTVIDWLERFSKLSAQKGHHFDTMTLTSSAEWQKLLRKISNIKAVVSKC